MNNDITILELLAQIPLPDGVQQSLSAISGLNYKGTKALQQSLRDTANKTEYDAGIDKMLTPTEAIMDYLCRIHDLLLWTCPDRSFGPLHAKGPALPERSM